MERQKKNIDILIHSDRQRQTDRPKLTGRGQTNTPIGREIGGQTDGQTERQTERKAQPKVILKLICIEFVVFFQ